jgi:hypothetical protein
MVNSHIPVDTACTICGDTSYSWGQLKEQSQVEFIRDDASFLETFTAWGGEEVRARLCESCGNIQLFKRSYRNDE